MAISTIAKLLVNLTHAVSAVAEVPVQHIATVQCLHALAPHYLAVDCVPVTSLVSRRHLQSAQSGCLVTGAKKAPGTRNFAVTVAKI